MNNDKTTNAFTPGQGRVTRPALSLVRPGNATSFAVTTVATFGLTGALHGVDNPPRMAALATFIEGLLDGEGFDVVHTVDGPGVRPAGISASRRAMP